MSEPKVEGETSLKALLGLKYTRMVWKLEDARDLVRCVAEGESIRSYALRTGKNVGSVGTFRRELIEAAKKGYTLERYLAEGRPFHPKNKEVD